jgi:hypothetical protein
MTIKYFRLFLLGTVLNELISYCLFVFRLRKVEDSCMRSPVVMYRIAGLASDVAYCASLTTGTLQIFYRYYCSAIYKFLCFYCAQFWSS